MVQRNDSPQGHNVKEGNAMTKRQIEWARQHDWFTWVREDGAVLVRDYTEDGAQTFRAFTDYRELRAWAGY